MNNKWVGFIVIALALSACSGQKGNPELVTKAEKAAAEMCGCQTQDCAWKVDTAELSAFTSGDSNMTEAEEAQFNVAMNKLNACNMKLFPAPQ
ncbi:MAG: hypothetical protein COX57_13120 [Alphaproteobacteria bacterium CG_4_10_14_0_2_um_filter_63_37]|nr:MAG: hypothetical protein AUJ55_06140 [Proteobacteria bacterium CG1_02_64_396]PJA23565.1 MAG: hypothetical protein COX57_13120 [Alphaproteobacteria bacterium CG_4_10_14_0_2_um_filter_63_37]